MGKKRILVVDDETQLTRFLKTNLEKTGLYDVREENNSKNALTAAHEFRPDLVLLDVVMQDLDGGEIASQIRADPHLKDTRVVFLTGILEKEKAGPEIQDIGGSLFIAKPLDLKQLLKHLQDLLPP